MAYAAQVVLALCMALATFFSLFKRFLDGSPWGIAPSITLWSRKRGRWEYVMSLSSDRWFGRRWGVSVTADDWDDHEMISLGENYRTRAEARGRCRAPLPRDPSMNRFAFQLRPRQKFARYGRA